MLPRTIAEALAETPAANLAIISTPGPYATAEALKALKRGLHVFLFSDNVPIADEIELKRLARKKGLLMMGPDCGTAILDGVPLGFANAVRRGRIGLVGASGTGLQQVSCLIDRLGEGVSQLIGVGGRDLDERVGGLMMLAGIDVLSQGHAHRGDRSRLEAARALGGAPCPRPGVCLRQARGRELPGRRRGSNPSGRSHAGRHAGGGRTHRRDPGARRARERDGRSRSGARGPGAGAGRPLRRRAAPRARALQRRHALPGSSAHPGRVGGQRRRTHHGRSRGRRVHGGAAPSDDRLPSAERAHRQGRPGPDHRRDPARRGPGLRGPSGPCRRVDAGRASRRASGRSRLAARSGWWRPCVGPWPILRTSPDRKTSWRRPE